MGKAVVLLDVDGTLVTCGGAGRRAMEAAFRDLCGRADVCDFAFGGGTDRAIARRGLTNAGHEPSEAAIDALLARYLEHLPGSLASSRGYAVLPGVEGLLGALGDRAELAVGLGTGNVEVGARAKLRPAGLDARFAFGGFGCDAEERAALLEAGARRGAARLGIERAECRVIVIGDTPRDVAAAAAIGAECVAAATGSHRVEELAHATLAVADLRAPELLELVLAR